MEIKIGVKDAAREVVLETGESADSVAQAVSEAVQKGTLLALTDERGRRVLVPGAVIAYVELGVEERPRVGFGTL